jgi:hypothetical protein
VPPYWIFNAAPALSKWKAAWKDVSGAITGKGVLQACVIGSIDDPKLGTRTIVPEHKVMFIETRDEDEAHYLAAILNSSLLRLIIASYTMERQIGTHLTKYVRIPKYDSDKSAHRELVACSKKAHAHPETRESIERTIDKLTTDRSVFDITDAGLQQVREDLETLLD